jgi:penicillin-binding protein 1A
MKHNPTTLGRPTPMQRAWRWTVRLFWLGVFGAIAAVLSFAGLIAYYGRDLPDVEHLRDYRPAQTTRVLDRNGRLIGEIFTERRTVISSADIPNVMVVSMLAAEDANFYAHRGLDYRGIARAILRDIATGRAAQGASTITQQIVKVLLLNSERTLARKVRELVLARRIEQTMTKEEILALYLNVINFGDGRYGVEEAAQYYFGKHARDMTLAEASLLAGLPQSPTRHNPFHNLESAQRRQRYVLGQLEAKLETHFSNHITLEDIRVARDTTITLADPHRSRSAAPEIMDMVRRDLRAMVGEEAFRRGGFRVETSIDLELTEKSREALRLQLERIDTRQGYRGPLQLPRPTRRNTPVRPLPELPSLRTGRSYPAEVTGTDDAEGRIDLDVGGHRAYARMRDLARANPESLTASAFAPRGARVQVSLDAIGEADTPSRARLEMGPEGAVVVIDPRTRGIRVLIGGSTTSVGFNRATQGHRQPGSTFKAFVYAAAIRSRRFTAASLITPEEIAADSLITRVPDVDDVAEPVRLRRALARSLNPVAIHLFLTLGAEPIIALARDAGISSPLDPNPALALGASEVTPLELVNAYTTFAAGGRFETAHYLERILGPDGRPIALPGRRESRQVLQPAEAYMVTSLLRSVVEEGTATTAQNLHRPTVGKTGTSNEARDTWFVGYTAQTVAGVWVGFDDHRPLGRREEGARSALPVFIDVVRTAEGDRGAAGFPLPVGIDLARIDPRTGLLAPAEMVDAIDEQFLAGTAPTTYAEIAPVVVPVDAGVPSEAPEAPANAPTEPAPSATTPP